MAGAGHAPAGPGSRSVAATRGGTIADVAQIVHLSKGTVRNHLSSAIGKTGGQNRADAVQVLERGWL